MCASEILNFFMVIKLEIGCVQVAKNSSPSSDNAQSHLQNVATMFCMV